MSTTTNNRDAKGRVSVPADFRSVIAAQNAALLAAQDTIITQAGIEPFDGIIVRPSFDGQCLEGGGEVLFNAYCASINAMDHFDPERDVMEHSLFGESRRLSFDSGGRVSLPQDWADRFGYNGRITFVGLGDRFEIWQPEAHEARAAEMRKIMAEKTPFSKTRIVYRPKIMSRDVASVSRPHYPVMLPEVLASLAAKDGEVYVDGTFGNGGYSEAFLRAANVRVIGLDRDVNVRPRADDLSHEYDGRFELIQMPFSHMDTVGLPPVDAVVLDIGVSSMQLDQAQRGFSFMRAGPLDMRMGPDGPTAAMAVNQMGHGELANIFKVYGEERQAGRIASAILRVREDGNIVTTDALASLIEKAIGRPGGKAGKTHPATRVFQALRIFVNDELGELYRGLCAAEAILKPGGRLIVVTFHSLEDRIVKSFFRRRAGEVSGGSRHAPEIIRADVKPSFTLARRAVVKPSDIEISENPRSRSAKLRSAVRTDAAPFDTDEVLLPKVPSVHDVRWAS